MLFRDTSSTLEMREIWSESATVSAWLRIEKTLAEIQVEMGLIPSDAATALAAVTLEDINLDLLTEEIVLARRPIVGFVKQLREHVGSRHARSIHFGTTTQNIMDTATILQMSEGLDHVFQTLKEIMDELDPLAEQHAQTTKMGRANIQDAKSIAFGMKVHLWQKELYRRFDKIVDASKYGLQVQFGGPVGILNNFNETSSKALRKALADRLGLRSADLAWQNTREGLSDILLALGQLSASIEKIAHYLSPLSTSDIGEHHKKTDRGTGASLSMAQKYNQRCSEFAEAIGSLARNRAMQIFETSKHVYERSGGAWISEGVIIPEVFLLTSGAMKWTKLLFSNLNVDDSHMLES